MNILSDLLTLFLYLTSNRKGGPGPFSVHNDPVQVTRSDATSGTYYNNGLYDLRHAIRFRLWTRENPILAHEIVVHDLISLRTSNFDHKRLTKIFVHGKDQRSNEERLDPETVYLRDAYLRFGDVNFVLVDWTSLAKTYRYFTNYGDIVSERIAQFVRFLERHGTPIETVHGLGLSWGSHVMGNAGRLLRGKMGRITGFDPAGPLFVGLSEKYILDKTDARFVDIIHTDAGGPIGIHAGLEDPLGHVDFYPNGGKTQPGCPPKDVVHHRDTPCSHERSVDLFSESIGSPLSYPSCTKKSWNEYLRSEQCNEDEMTFMGEHIPVTTRGIFYLKTMGGRPYGLGNKMDIILPNVAGVRRNRQFVFDINRFRFNRVYNQRITGQRSGLDSQITKTETNFSPSNNTNIEFLDNASSYTPKAVPNNDILIESIRFLTKLRSSHLNTSTNNYTKNNV